MDNSFVCQFCNKSFVSKYTLSIHKKTTKKCLDIQKQLVQPTDIKLYECEYCNYTSTIK